MATIKEILEKRKKSERSGGEVGAAERVSQERTTESASEDQGSIKSILERRKRYGVSMYRSDLGEMDEERFGRALEAQEASARDLASDYLRQASQAPEGYQTGEIWDEFNKRNRAVYQENRNRDAALRQYGYLNALEPDGYLGALDEWRGLNDEISRGALEQRDYWRKYENEKDWMRALADEAAAADVARERERLMSWDVAGHEQKIAGADRQMEALRAADYEAMPDDTDERQRVQRAMMAGLVPDGVPANPELEGRAFAPVGSSAQAQRQSDMKELRELEAQREALAGDGDYVRAKYEQRALLPEFEDKAAEGAKASPEGGLWSGDARLHALINRDADAVAREAQAASQTENPNVRYGEMTDDEIKTYNYLVAAEGLDEARRYLDVLMPSLNERYAGGAARQTAELAKEHPAVASVGSVAMTGARAAGYPYAAAQALGGEAIDPNSPWFAAGMTQDVIRGTVSQEILDSVDSELLGNTLSFLYNVGMSMADFVSLSAMTAGLSPNVSLAVMGLGSASQATRDALERGGTDEQAVAVGLMAGIAEALFEKVGLDNLISATSPAASFSLIKNMAKQAGIEASEEALTELANWVTDYVVMGGLSKHAKAEAAYLELGHSQAEAGRLARVDAAKEIGMAALGGAVSGGVLGGGAGVMGDIQTAGLGKQIERVGLTGDVVARGSEAGAGSLALEQAQRNQGRMDEGAVLRNRDIGRQYLANLEAAGEGGLDVGALGEALEGMEDGQAQAGLELARGIAQGELSLEQAEAVLEDGALRGVYEGFLGAVTPEMSAEELQAKARFLGAGARFDAWRVEAAAAARADAARVAGDFGAGGLVEDSAGVEGGRAASAALDGLLAGSEMPRSAEGEALVGTAREPVLASFEGAAGAGGSVAVTGLAALSDGAAVVALSDGGRALVDDLRFDNSVSQGLYARAADYEDVGAARAFLAGYDASLGDVEAYSQAFRRFYEAGRLGVDRAELSASPFAGMLSVAAREMAYISGAGSDKAGGVGAGVALAGTGAGDAPARSGDSGAGVDKAGVVTRSEGGKARTGGKADGQTSVGGGADEAGGSDSKGAFRSRPAGGGGAAARDAADGTGDRGGVVGRDGGLAAGGAAREALRRACTDGTAGSHWGGSSGRSCAFWTRWASNMGLGLSLRIRWMWWGRMGRRFKARPTAIMILRRGRFILRGTRWRTRICLWARTSWYTM